jgi:beta-galactosidase
VPTVPAVLFGAAYYSEYQPYPRLEEDLDLMAAAGFSVIRVGESVWSTWEPREGEFDLDWLAPVLDAAHRRGIHAVIGTPTYAVPPWLRARYPETAAQRGTGVPVPYGHRQDADFTHPAFRFLAGRLVKAIVARYAGHPAVIGWQVDNEPGLELLHNPAVFARFVDRLRAEYRDVAALNRAWGLTYWSHRLADFGELWPPDGNSVPGYDLAWRRFQAELTTEFVRWQAGIVREGARPDQFVTTCLALGRPALDATTLSTGLDVAAVNVYYPMQDRLTLPAPREPVLGGAPAWLPDSGVAALYLAADTTYGLRGEPFLVTETVASSIGEAHVNYPAYDGQWRQAAWALVARGARMIEYWHWHTLHYGHETYWGGVLGHGLRPGRCYTELARVGAEFRAADGELAGLVPDAQAALVVSPDSRWAQQFQPPLPVPGGVTGDPHSYDRIVAAFHRALFDAGIPVRVLDARHLDADPATLAERWPVLVVPALYVTDDATLTVLGQYAHAGGHLVVGFRTGYADTEARPRWTPAPPLLLDAAGVRYTEFTNLAAPVPVETADGLDAGGAATAWADGLEPAGASVLARYRHPHLRRFAAITTNEVGAGRLTYVGTLFDQRLGAALGRFLRSRSLPAGDWAAVPASVTVTSARNAGGRRLWFLHNWSFDPVTVCVPIPVEDVLVGTEFNRDDQLTLQAWDVRVLGQPARGAHGTSEGTHPR